MNVWKKLSALTFVLALALALSVSAFASEPATLTNGKVGSANVDGTPPTALSNIVKLKKELRVFNETPHNRGDNAVFAPAFSYTYSVSAAEVPTDAHTVTDENGTSAPVKAGILKGLKVGDASTPTAGVNNTDPVTGTLTFTTAMSLTASSSGAINTYYIPLDFSGVNFITGDGAQGTGVYRYKIDEALTGSPAYSTLSMVDGGMNTVYLDVYVKGNGDIYGYVCLPNTVGNADVVTTPTETVKVDGFVYSTTVNQNGADDYFTYDLQLSKTVTNDSYAQSNHAFPFTVVFTPASTMTANFKIAQTITQAANGETATTGFSTIAESTTGWNGVVYIKHGANILFTGIPCGMKAAVYETNNMTGVTYKVTTTINGEARANPETVSSTTDSNILSTAQTARAVYQSLKAEFEPMIAQSSAKQTCAIDNALVNVSPTGVTLRYAPYLLTLGAGVTVLPLTRRYKKREDEV